MMHYSCSGLSFPTNQMGLCLSPQSNLMKPEDEIVKLVFSVQFYFVSLKSTRDFPESKETGPNHI